jgi:hypothetical protein
MSPLINRTIVYHTLIAGISFLRLLELSPESPKMLVIRVNSRNTLGLSFKKIWYKRERARNLKLRYKADSSRREAAVFINKISYN